MSLARQLRDARRCALRMWFATCGLAAGIVLATIMALLTRFDQWRR
ncbi:MAG TPA: hypothetical protein VLB44_16130 [Kofleriaceae bacterium]|nr:hypothetical protein [Kofleriaceae bacterium]